MSVLNGCAAGAAEPGLEPLGGAAEALRTTDVDVPFTGLDVQKSDAPAGLTVLRTAAEYRAFFGARAPAGVFPRSWVVHYSMGVMSTGGYSVEITGVTRASVPEGRALNVDVVTRSPGPECIVTTALTNPQVAVTIAAQPSRTRRLFARVDAQLEACGACDPSQCPVPRVACRICQDGSAACPEATCEDGECGVIFNRCPEDVPCGGIAGIECPEGSTCVDDPGDSCDPDDGHADCAGRCVAECTGPMPSCAAPPAGCNYQGAGCVDGSWTCGTLVCGEPCGDTFCGDGMVCCNPLRSTCTRPGMVCIQ